MEHGRKCFGLSFMFEVVNTNSSQEKHDRCSKTEQDKLFSSDNERPMESLNRFVVSGKLHHAQQSKQTKCAYRPKVKSE